jgi:hypothetical protein
MTKTVVPEAKKAKKTRKKTEKSGTAKKTTKEGVKRKRAKDMGMKVSEEAMLEQKAKEEALKNEALDFYRLLRQQFGLEPFDGVAIDFHKRKPAVVSDPKTEMIHTVALDDLQPTLSRSILEEQWEKEK